MARLLFDKRDDYLLNIVNDVLTRDKSRKGVRNLVLPYLHPHGIKEMAESKGLRIAFAVIHLLESLEAGGVDDRLSALRSLREEILGAAGGSLPINTARVLLTIMKELVRAHGNERRQLELAHDFRTAATGNPRIIRNQLRRYHLLEMPEEWNQATFDDHVHDVNTKGRKTSSHLIMDAWIKGIRRLRVIYYNYVEAKFAVELLEAASIMGITVRIGIEFYTRIHNRYAQLIWVPRGFPDTQSFLCFLADNQVAAFMSEGKAVSRYQQRYVWEVLQVFNDRHRHALRKAYGCDLQPIDPDEFAAFVGAGQPSIVHLGEFIHKKMLDTLKGCVASMRERYPSADPTRRLEMEGLVDEMNRLDSEALIEKYLHPSKNPEIPDPAIPVDSSDLPSLLKLPAPELISRLARLHSAYRVTLNLSNLRVEDVLELLYDCEGAITRLEIFNLKDYSEGKTAHIPQIHELQQAVNDGNVMHLKGMIRAMIGRLKAGSGNRERIEKLTMILHDISALKDAYRGTPLKARIGSDSTGRAPRVHGMGLAVEQTLPLRARREITRPSAATRMMIPIRVEVFRRSTFIPRGNPSTRKQVFFRLMRVLPGLNLLFEKRLNDWVIQEQSIHMESPGNIVTLGGIQKAGDNGLTLNPPEKMQGRPRLSWRYLNTGVKNALKVLIGFIPAFLTFYLTKDWWLLAYFGAVIWFGITGLRNVLQSVLGGGGIRRSPLLRWNDYLSWERITDSLLYTGFSVPLLDYVVKTLVLDRAFGINTTTNPIALYACIALANGLYLSSHNLFRGLPKSAVFGNFFRTLLSIPIAIAVNATAGRLLTLFGYTAVDLILQKWAAIISKLASDLVAGLIEGTVDRYQNIQMRWRDYRTKIAQMFDVYAQLELLLPEKDGLDLLRASEESGEQLKGEVADLYRIIVINSLDLLYFWMYQPRARTAFKAILENMPPEERSILLNTQFVLQNQRQISLLFVDGLVGKNFSRALAFYLDRSTEYLAALKRSL
ncbi:conserved membrane hypothetical protein [uncultured Desulfatiglans sp.]|uniref:Uncharacterized protein n=1 Tax=Uncultured Desulfatiglans sp. TaxID=1748965 RepID=A0A653AHR9_UNCDX|nr:conserved membrane hypothetical protein [uncultured Desulfatiglans sp.]